MRHDKCYSIWLMPKGNLSDELQRIILGLSDKFSSPKFLPHVTLIGDIEGDESEILAKANELAREINPFEIKLGNISYLDEYLRCLFFNLEITPDYETAIKKAVKKFGNNFNPKYMKHLSILYGNFSPESKRGAVKNIRISAHSFTADRLHLYFTGGSPENWHEVKRYSLNKSKTVE